MMTNEEVLEKISEGRVLWKSVKKKTVLRYGGLFELKIRAKSKNYRRTYWNMCN